MQKVRPVEEGDAVGTGPAGEIAEALYERILAARDAFHRWDCTRKSATITVAERAAYNT